MQPVSASRARKASSVPADSNYPVQRELRMLGVRRVGRIFARRFGCRFVSDPRGCDAGLAGGPSPKARACQPTLRQDAAPGSG